MEDREEGGEVGWAEIVLALALAVTACVPIAVNRWHIHEAHHVMR